MSHETKVKTSIRSKKILKEALDELRMEYDEGDLQVKSAYNVNSKVELRLKNNPSVGFSKTADGSYQAVGDFYESNINEEDLKNNVQQKVAYLTALENLRSKGFYVDENSITKNEKGEQIFQAVERY